MEERRGEDIKKIKTKEEVEDFLERLRFVLNQESTIITLQEIRYVDSKRTLEYTNRYALAKLFPNESPKDALRRELKTLRCIDYIETVKDTRYPKLSDFWVFGKKYNGNDVYIKIRVEIVPRNYVFVMSFHFSTYPFAQGDFPYARGEGGE